MNNLLHMNSIIYMTDEYLKIWAGYDGAVPLSIQLEGGSGVFKVTMLIKKIIRTDNLFEAYTPYGYGGPLLIEGNEKSCFPFEKFLDELKSRNIIDAFIRFSPFLQNHKYFPLSAIELNRYTVSRRLGKASFEKLIRGFSKGTKWAIKKSINLGVKVSVINGEEIAKTDIDNFYKLYFQNMEAVKAEDYYFLTKKCISDHFLYLRKNIDLFVAKLNNKWIAASLFIKDDKMCHYHLSASDREYSKFYPADRILFEAIIFYGNERKEILHLGGGLSLSKDDPLFKFKKKFGNEINKFYIGKVIVNDKLYNTLRVENKIRNSRYFLINDALEKKQ